MRMGMGRKLCEERKRHQLMVKAGEAEGVRNGCAARGKQTI